MDETQARLNITYSGENGDLPDPVFFDSSEGDVKQWAAEAVQEGSVPGIPASADANFTDFVVERYPAKADVPEGDPAYFNRIMLRPKTPFGRYV
jgi:hypothetical protein